MIRLDPPALYSRRIVLWAYAHGLICVLSKDQKWRDIIVGMSPDTARLIAKVPA